jgi:hypothetical protein
MGGLCVRLLHVVFVFYFSLSHPFVEIFGCRGVRQVTKDPSVSAEKFLFIPPFKLLNKRKKQRHKYDHHRQHQDLDG